MSKYLTCYGKSLRFGVFFLLGCMIAIIGYFSFFILHQNERRGFDRVYDSSSDRILQGVSFNLQAKLLAATSAGNIYTYASEENLIGTAPNLTLPGFDAIMQPITKLAGIRSIGFLPILDNTTRKGWEAYARSHFDEIGNISFPSSTIKNGWDVTRGVYRLDSSGQRVYDPGNFPGSKYPDILTPVWQISPLDKNSRAIMFNSHSEKLRVAAIDKLISTKSPVFTDLITLVVDEGVRPASIIFSPIVPLKGKTAIGIIFATMTWDDMLENTLPSYIHGIHCVLSTSTQQFTFLLRQGGVELVGDGDLHDRRFSGHRKDITSSLDSVSSILATDYTIELYPTKDFVDAYITAIPGVLCGSFIGIIVVTAFVVFCYDYFTRNEQKKLLEELVLSDLKSKLSDLALRELQMKTSFIRYVSHEVRNPLNIVALGLDHLRQHFPENDSDFLETIGELEGATRHAVEIMDNLLTFEKLTSNVLEIRQIEVPVIEYLQKAIRSITIQAKHKGVEVRLDFDEEISRNNPRILLDKLKINHVIRNLLSNAIEVAPDGTNIDIKASLVSSKPPKRRSRVRRSSKHTERTVLRVEVTDHGPGISPEDQKRLFQEVTEFTPGEFHNGKGSGLGLWISHEIVSLHQGKLSVFSAGLGCGTTFTMDLPLQGSKDVNPIRHNRGGSWNSQGVVETGLMDSSMHMLSSSLHDSGSFVIPFKMNTHMPVQDHLQSLREVRNPEQTRRDHASLEYRGHDRHTRYVTARQQSDQSEVNSFGSHRGYVSEHTVREEDPMLKSYGFVVKDDHCAYYALDSEKRVLIVDDVLMNRKMLKRLLEHRWKHISIAQDGREALEMVKDAMTRGEVYDIILMDFEMPNMNGPDAAAAIRDVGYTGLIIGVTGNGLPVDVNRFISKGANRVLIKPINITMLDDCLTSLASSKP